MIENRENRKIYLNFSIQMADIMLDMTFFAFYIYKFTLNMNQQQNKQKIKESKSQLIPGDVLKDTFSTTSNSERSNIAERADDLFQKVIWFFSV